MIKIRAVLQILKAYLKPYQYVRDSGIKFSGGGANRPVWKSLQNFWERPLHDYFRRQCAHHFRRAVYHP